MVQVRSRKFAKLSQTKLAQHAEHGTMGSQKPTHNGIECEGWCRAWISANRLAFRTRQSGTGCEGTMKSA